MCLCRAIHFPPKWRKNLVKSKLKSRYTEKSIVYTASNTNRDSIPGNWALTLKEYIHKFMKMHVCDFEFRLLNELLDTWVRT